MMDHIFHILLRFTSRLFGVKVAMHNDSYSHASPDSDESNIFPSKGGG